MDWVLIIWVLLIFSTPEALSASGGHSPGAWGGGGGGRPYGAGWGQDLQESWSLAGPVPGHGLSNLLRSREEWNKEEGRVIHCVYSFLAGYQLIITSSWQWQLLSVDSNCTTNLRPPVQLTVEVVEPPKGLMEQEQERRMWRLRLGREM